MSTINARLKKLEQTQKKQDNQPIIVREIKPGQWNVSPNRALGLPSGSLVNEKWVANYPGPKIVDDLIK